MRQTIQQNRKTPPDKSSKPAGPSRRQNSQRFYTAWTLSGHSAPLTNVVFDDATGEAGEDRREGGQSKCGSISKIRPSDGCGGETIAATVKFAYDRHGFESYMGNVG